MRRSKLQPYIYILYIGNNYIDTTCIYIKICLIQVYVPITCGVTNGNP